MGLHLTNTSQYLRKEGDTHWWEWEAFIDASDPQDYEDIEYVEYLLHPTFPEPIIRRRNAGKKFALKTVGWGTFEIKAVVHYKDPSKNPETLTHNLEFEDAE